MAASVSLPSPGLSAGDRATPHPCRHLASGDGWCMLLVSSGKDKLVSQARSRAGCCLPGSQCSGKQGGCEMHENVVFLSCCETRWYRGCRWVMLSRARHCDGVPGLPWEVLPALLDARKCSPCLKPSSSLGIQVNSTSMLSILYLIIQELFATPLLQLPFPAAGFNRKQRIFFRSLTPNDYFGHFMAFAHFYTLKRRWPKIAM